MEVSMRRTIQVLACLAALPLTGCIAVAAGAAAGYGAVKYSKNEQGRDYAASLAATWNATIATLRGMGYPIADGTAPGPTEGRIAIEDVVVEVMKFSDSVTRVEVRFGTFDSGDHRRRADLLLDGIAKRLGGPS
jgi:hypothetical protein